MKYFLPGSDSNLEDYLPFKDINMIVTDIDGTVISGTEPVRRQIKDTIKYLQRQKVQLTVATGRIYYGAGKLLKDLEIKQGMPIALYNGGIVLEHQTENVLYSLFLDKDAVWELLNEKFLEKTNVYIYI